MTRNNPPSRAAVAVVAEPIDTDSTSAYPSVKSDARRQGWWVLGILSLLMGFASISTDLYLPAMPAMSLALGASSGAVEWTCPAI
jgi:MFS transporter, DHA1 family, multidrug resistance protein